MQSFPIENSSTYAQLVRECTDEISRAWGDSKFRLEFQQTVLTAAVAHLEALITSAQLNARNCLFVVAGKSAGISLSLLDHVAEQTQNPHLKTLISATQTLEEEGNKKMYAGAVPARLQTDSQGKTIIFIDEHSEDYSKAISFLSSADRAGLPSKFFVFAGRAIRSNPAVAEYGNRILKVTAKDSMVDFLKNLGRLESERVRVQQFISPEKKASLQRSVVEDLTLASRLVASFKRQ